MNVRHHHLSIKPFFIPVMLSLFLLLYVLPHVFSQTSSSTIKRNSLIEMQNDLLVKSRKQKTWAWVILGTGIVGTAVNGLAVASGGSNFIFSFGQDKFQDYDGSAGLLLGAAIIASSIPLFNAGNKNLNKAIRMGLDLGTIHQLPDINHYGRLGGNSSGYFGESGILPGIRVSYTF